jgi:hypothetical protein
MKRKQWACRSCRKKSVCFVSISYRGGLAMRRVIIFSLLVVVMTMMALIFCTAVAIADWKPGDPTTKYVQMPDPNGMNVNATYIIDTNQMPPVQPVYPWQKILADDFLCTQTGPITDIHIWGSWLEDRIPWITDPTNGALLQNVRFKLSLHKNVPAGVDAPYSHPGQEFWRAIFQPDQYVSRFWSNSNELFYEPNTNRIIGTDHQIWQYNFKLPVTDASSWQFGTEANPQIYWLDVQAIIPEPAPVPGTTELPQFVFGWKTSLDHFPATLPIGDDDAVFGDTLVPGGVPYPQFPDPSGTNLLPWKDMRYPPQSPYYPNSINLAFVITTIPEPGTVMMMLGACLFASVLYFRRR